MLWHKIDVGEEATGAAATVFETSSVMETILVSMRSELAASRWVEHTGTSYVVISPQRTQY
jgi:hypothetical protein